MIFDFPDPSDWLTITRFGMFESSGEEPQADAATDDTDVHPYGELGISDHSRTASTSPVSAGRTSSSPVVSLADRRQTT